MTDKDAAAERLSKIVAAWLDAPAVQHGSEWWFYWRSRLRAALNEYESATPGKDN